MRELVILQAQFSGNSALHRDSEAAGTEQWLITIDALRRIKSIHRFNLQ